MFGLMAAVLLAGAAQLPPPSSPPTPPRAATPRYAAPPRTGTAVIRGRIIERDTDIPVVRLPVKLFRVGWMRPYEAQTDEQGRFVFTRLAAGQYRVSAEPARNRASHLPKWFIEQPAEPGGPAKPIELADGEVREGVDIALARLVVINGRVLDEHGDPLADIRVQAEPLSEGPGLRTSRSRTTDDRGVFRLFGLAAGRCRVCAEPDNSFDERTVEAFVRTCYPGTLTEEDSPAVTVTAGESAELDIRLLRTRVFTVSGTVLDVSGAPAEGVTANLTRIQKNGASGRSLQLDGAGRFTVRGLAPGEYAVHAQVGGLRSDDREQRVAYMPFTLASDIEGLVLTLGTPARVAGRLTFEDGPPQRLSLTIGVVDAPQIYGRPGGSRRNTQVREDLTFELNDLYGQQVLFVEGLPREWVVGSVRYRNENITGLPAEFKSSSDPQDLQIVLTSRVASVVARVVDDGGKPSKDGRVMMFPVDPRQWVASQGVVHHGNPQKDGSINVGPVRPGEYFIVAAGPEVFILHSRPVAPGGAGQSRRADHAQ